MYDPSQLDLIHDRLEAAVKNAMAEGDYELAARCASAIDAAKKWEQSGFHGPPPLDVQELSGVELVLHEEDLPVEPVQPEVAPVAPPSLVEEVRQSEPDLDEEESARKPPPPVTARKTEDGPSFDLGFDAPASMSQVDQALEAQLERGKRSLSDGRFREAIADFEAVAERAESSNLRADAQRYLKQAERSQYEKITKAIDKARKHGRDHRRDFKGRRAQWEAVLALDSDNQEALEAIKEIEAAEFEQNLRSTIDELRKPLQKRDKRITDVEAARNRASELLTGGQLRDPELIAEVQDVYAKLDELRNQILKASEGGTSSERSEQYELAMAIFRKAILDGLTEIVDDVHGTPVDPVEALKRTRMAYFEDLKKRAKQRKGDAEANLKAGAPEAALRWLKEAQDLAGKVEEGGEELRKQVNDLLDKATHANSEKQEAEKLVLDAQKHDDPVEARLLLMRAKQLYSAYPDIDSLIEGKESLVLLKIINDVTQDIANAEGALNARRFPDARQHCNQALSRGLNLEASNDELRAKRREAEQMLKVIGEREKNLADLLNKMAKIDQALKGGDLRLAQRLFDQLTPEERNSPEGQERQAQLGLASDDDTLYSQIERAFKELNFKLVLDNYSKLEQSPKYGERVRLLAYQSQARLWQQEIISLKRREGDRQQLEKLVRQMLALRGMLPKEDEFLLKEAEDELKLIEQQEQAAAAHEREINTWRRMRQPRAGDPPPPLGNEQWLRWYKVGEVLKGKLPESLHGELNREMEAGIQAWRAEALALAERVKWGTDDATRSLDENFARAYAILEPLYDNNLITPSDQQFRMIAQHYHAQEAVKLADSDDPEDLDAAVEHRREAFKVADPPARKERQELAATIKARALRLALLASLNPGPAGALQTLQTQLGEHELYLKEDVDVRQALIRYAVEARDHDTAAKQTVALGYLPNQTALARAWSQLAAVARRLSSQEKVDVATRAQAVDDLIRIRTEAVDNGWSTLQTVSQNACDDLADAMLAEVQGQSGTLSNDEVINQMRLNALVLQLRPDDSRAQAGVDALKGRLGDLSNTLVRRSREMAGAVLPLTEKVRQGETLLVEQDAVLKAFDLVKQGTSNDAQLLKGAQTQLSRQIQTWRTAGRQLEGLDAEWRRAVSETWDLSTLDELLAKATNTADQADVARWEVRIASLRTHLEALRNLFPRLEDAWNQEKLDEIGGVCAEIERTLNQARTELKEQSLAIPAHYVKLYDPFTRSSVESVSAARAAAEKKTTNLREWQQWFGQYTHLGKRAQEAFKSAEETFGSTPPCLTKAAVDYRTAQTYFNQVLALMDDIPDEALCGAAKTMSDRLPVAQLLSQFNRVLDQVAKRLAEIDSRQPELDRLIQRIKGWASQPNRQLHVEANRKTLQKLVEDAEAVDSCDKDVVGYRLLLNRLGGK
ncbi:MAG: hypothetical protein WA040_19545 [Anaerolineae bacterium]